MCTHLIFYLRTTHFTLHDISPFCEHIMKIIEGINPVKGTDNSILCVSRTVIIDLISLYTILYLSNLVKSHMLNNHREQNKHKVNASSEAIVESIVTSCNIPANYSNELTPRCFNVDTLLFQKVMLYRCSTVSHRLFMKYYLFIFYYFDEKNVHKINLNLDKTNQFSLVKLNRLVLHNGYQSLK